MKQKTSLSIRGFVIITFCALFVLTAVSLVEGQSGRRVPKKPDSPDPRPPAQSEPPVIQAEPKDEKPRIPVMVVKYQSLIGSSSMYSNDVAEGCMRKLQGSTMLKVRAGKDMNRKEASDYAKASEDTYVVWIQLEVDSAYSRNSDGIGYVNPYSLYVDFVLYTPGTGKSKTSGHVYQRRGTTGGLPRTGGGAEYSLRYAGEETGNRVLDALGLNLIHRN
jgi:hypothetical protein